MLGKRGMRRVHLVDAAPEIGGSMRWIPQLPGLGEWGRVVDYRRIQIDKLKNVQFIPKTSLDASGAIEYGADLIVVATGSRWATDGANALTRRPRARSGRGAPPLSHAGADHGRRQGAAGRPGAHLRLRRLFMGVSLAEKLASEGRRVTIVTPLPSAGPFLSFTVEEVHVHRTLKRLGVEIVAGHVLTAIEPGRIRGRSLGGDDERTWDAESVVLVTHRVSDRLYRDLSDAREDLAREGVGGLYRAGDCVEPRLIADAIFDGHRLAREIDTEDPAQFRPLLRENVTVATDLILAAGREQ